MLHRRIIARVQIICRQATGNALNQLTLNLQAKFANPCLKKLSTETAHHISGPHVFANRRRLESNACSYLVKASREEKRKRRERKKREQGEDKERGERRGRGGRRRGRAEREGEEERGEEEPGKEVEEDSEAAERKQIGTGGKPKGNPGGTQG